MLTRIVKLTFVAAKTSDFLEIFDSSKDLIVSFNGCSLLELHRDIHDPTIFFTYSKWQSEEHLNAYRNSELFARVWSETKALFAAKPEAWSIQLTHTSLQ